MSVLTGRSRAGWFASSQGLGAALEFGSSLEVEEGKAAGSYKEQLRGLDRYIELVNGVKYIIFLEYGGSQKAPECMVRISMRELSGDKLPKEMGKELKEQWNKI